MIKHSQTVLLKSLQKKFNFCLSSGIYPNSWANGYITAIHKGNDPTDPNNYRGITITGAIGKVFNRVLSLRLDKFFRITILYINHKLVLQKKPEQQIICLLLTVLSTNIVVQKMGDYLHVL